VLHIRKAAEERALLNLSEWRCIVLLISCWLASVIVLRR